LQALVERAKAAFDSGDPPVGGRRFGETVMDVVKSGAIGGRLMTVQESPTNLVSALNRLESLVTRIVGPAADVGAGAASAPKPCPAHQANELDEPHRRAAGPPRFVVAESTLSAS